MSLYKFTPAVASRLDNPFKEPSTVSSGKQYVYFDYIVWDSASRLLTFHLKYSSSDITLNGFSLRIHYDSTKASYEKETSYGTVIDATDIIGVGFDNILDGFKTTNQNIDNDTSNLDSSSSTDKFVRIDWDIKNGNSAAVDTWAGHNKADLLEFNLKVNNSVNSIDIGFSGDNSISSGMSLDSKKATIDLTSKDSSSNFTGAKIYDWQKSASDTSRGDALKQNGIVLAKESETSLLTKIEKDTFVVDKSKSSSVNYSIDNELDPTLYMMRGKTYTFEMVGSGHPFYLKTKSSTYGTNDEYTNGVIRIDSSNTKAGVDKLIFTVPYDAPNSLWYQCSAHQNMLGEIKIIGNYSKSDNHGLLDFTGISPENYVVGYKASNDSTTTASIKKAVNIDDIMLILKDIGKVSLLSNSQKVAADINQDTKVNIDDIMKILKIIGQVEKHSDLTNQFVVRDSTSSDPFSDINLNLNSGSSYS